MIDVYDLSDVFGEGMSTWGCSVVSMSSVLDCTEGFERHEPVDIPIRGETSSEAGAVTSSVGRVVAAACRFDGPMCIAAACRLDRLTGFERNEHAARFD